MSFLNSPELLNRYYTVAQIVMVVCGAITLIATGFTIFARLKLSALQGEAARTLDTRVKTAESSAAELRDQLGSAELQRQDLQARVEAAERWTQGRSLTPDQRDAFARILLSVPPGTVRMYAMIMDAESGFFKREITQALTAGGWIGDDAGNIDIIFYGVAFAAKSREDIPTAPARALLAAFRAIDIQPTFVEYDTGGTLTMIVGFNPRPKGMPANDGG